jgi:hypothetical protein
MRNLAPAMATVEVRAARIACRVADEALTIAGHVLVCVGAACSGAGERILARQQAIVSQPCRLRNTRKRPPPQRLRSSRLLGTNPGQRAALS